jgi:hypothetical protein
MEPAMPYRTSSGAKFAISTTVPATTIDSLTELAALTYTEVGGITTLGTYGDSRQTVDLQTLGDGRVRHLPAAADGGSLEIEVAQDKYDAGQKAMIAAFDSKQDYAFRVELPDAVDPDPNTMTYFVGPVMSKNINVNSNDSILSRTFNVAVNTEVFEDDGLTP